MIECKKTDWIASLLFPGGTQLAYRNYWSAGFFLLAWFAAWIFLDGFLDAVFIHLCAALHAKAVVDGWGKTHGGFDKPDSGGFPSFG
jgi:hypothetical protein